MPTFDFKLPDIGEGVMEGEIVSWLVEPGEAVTEDQPMVEVMTDKATVTIGAPKTGSILALEAEVGEVVPVGNVIVRLDVGGGAAAAPEAPVAEPEPAPVAEPEPAVAAPKPAVAPASAQEGPAATAVGDIRETLPGAAFFEEAAPAPAPPVGGHFDPRPRATPATRKLARDLGVDLRRVRGTGRGGRVTREDVEELAAQDAPTLRPGAAPRSPAAPDPIRIPPPAGSSGALEERVPFVGVRRKIAERMQRAKNTAAHFTFVEECDVTALTAVRDRMKPLAEARGVKLTFLPFIVRAVVAALKKHPILNSALDEAANELVYRKVFHIGIAAATEQGLMVPVVKNADQRSLLDLAQEIARLADDARAGRIAPADLAGSTFTVTSLGKQGGLFATPVLNFPEVGILGVHRIKERPVVRDGAIEIGSVMLLSLSLDHRIVDGHVGAAFAYDVIEALENPDLLFLET